MALVHARKEEQLHAAIMSRDVIGQAKGILMARQGVLPINVALAYVLSQAFPTFALIGTRQLSETRTSFAALNIDLSPAEISWLNLE